MGAHPVDVFIRNGSLLGILVIAIVLSTHKAMDTAKSRAGDIVCWTPAQFTSQHILYANTICSQGGRRYDVDMVGTPPQHTPSNDSFRIYKFQEISERQVIKQQSRSLLCILFGEAALAGITFLLASAVSTIACATREQLKDPFVSFHRSSSNETDAEGEKITRNPKDTNNDVTYIQGLQTSYVISVLYVLIQLATAISWFFVGIVTYNKWSYPTEKVEGMLFMCAFDMRHQSRIHSYVIQCFQFGSSDDTPWFEVAHQANFLLCLTMTSCILMWLAFLVVVFPLWSIRNARRQLVNVHQAGNMVNGVTFGFSDFCWATLFRD